MIVMSVGKWYMLVIVYCDRHLKRVTILDFDLNR